MALYCCECQNRLDWPFVRVLACRVKRPQRFDDPRPMSEQLPQSDRPASIGPPSVGPPSAAAFVPSVTEPAAIEEIVEQPALSAEPEFTAEPDVVAVAEAEAEAVEVAEPEAQAESIEEPVQVHAPEPIGEPSAGAREPEIETVTISPLNDVAAPRLVAVPDPIGSVESTVDAEAVATTHPEIVNGDAGLRVLAPVEGVRTPAQILEQIERARAANAALTAQLVGGEQADAA